MKKAGILLFLMFGGFALHAQLSSCYKNLQVVQINFHAIPGNVIELGYVNLSHKYLNFQVKGSYRRYKDPDSRYPYVFASTLAYIKPGLIFVKKSSLSRTFFLSLNPILGFSKDSIIVTIDDPLLGKIKKGFGEENLHFSLELEANYIVDLSERVGLSFGGFAGCRIIDPKPFSTYDNGIFQEHDFVGPGTGYYTLFAGVNIGVVVGLNRASK